MILRLMLALLAGLSAAFVSAQEASPPPRVAIETSAGRIVVALDPVHAPLTTANFLRYVDEKRFDGTSFYRAINYGDGVGLIQGGTRGEVQRRLPPIAHEPTTQTGLSHVAGTLSMARYAPGSATGDFFITTSDVKSLDADPAQPGDNAGFAAFGHVVEGMDVALAILVMPTSPTEGDGVMKGQMLSPVVQILSARRVE